MSTQAAYARMTGRKDVETESKEEHEERLASESELKTWLTLPKTRELLTFLGRRELELLNSARNAAKMVGFHEHTSKYLMKSAGYREVIEYLTENKQPEKE